jgi:hypothetical protein
MGCCLGVVGLLFPRIALFVLWITGLGGEAWNTVLWPLLGFFFMPYTTLFYGIAMLYFDGLQGLGLVLLIIGVLLDFAGHGGTGHSVRTRYRYKAVR